MSDQKTDEEQGDDAKPVPWKLLFTAILAFALAGFFFFLEELGAVAILPDEAALSTSQGTIVAIESWVDDDNRRPSLRLSGSTYWYVFPRVLRVRENWLERELRRAPSDALVTVLHRRGLPPVPADAKRRYVPIYALAVNDHHHLTYADTHAAFEDSKKWQPLMTALFVALGILFAYLAFADFRARRLKTERQ